MRYNHLGRTGLFVSELCLGTMTFGGGEGMWRQIGTLAAGRGRRAWSARALDAGINFIDTADVYSDGQSEEITGQALRTSASPRDNVVVATKVVRPMTATGRTRAAPRAATSSTRSRPACERLQLDHIDLYQIHGFDPATPIEETLRALDKLVRHGHVRYVGVSNWAAWQIAKALGIAERLRPRALRVAAGLLHHRRPRPRARDRADAAEREASA